MKRQRVSLQRVGERRVVEIMVRRMSGGVRGWKRAKRGGLAGTGGSVKRRNDLLFGASWEHWGGGSVKRKNAFVFLRAMRKVKVQQ